jgi:bacterioferritin (cytochrome b1)
MKQSLDFLVQTLLDIDLRSEQETMEHYPVTIVQTGYAAESVRSAKLTDIVTQEMRHEVGLNDGLGLR